MTLTVHLSEELARRLAAEAARRGVSVEQIAAEALEAGLEDRAVVAGSPKRRLAFAAIGASGQARGGAEADELLAEGFGRH
jgi:predicted transcriptional regulator